MTRQSNALGSFFRYMLLKIARQFTRQKCNILKTSRQDQDLSLNTIRNCASSQDGCLKDTDYL